MSRIFPYKAIKYEPSLVFPTGFTSYRPTIPISISSGGKRVEAFECIADTGADWCMFPSDYLELLGIDRKTLPTAPIHGVGEDPAVAFATVTISIEGFGEWQVLASFSEKLRSQNFGFMGHSGFFERFIVMFNTRDKVCLVSEKGELESIDLSNLRHR